MTEEKKIFLPQNDYVIAYPHREQKDIYMPDNPGQGATLCRIEAVDDGVSDRFQVGDFIITDDAKTRKIHFDGNKYYAIKAEDIIAKTRKTEEEK